VIRAWRRILVRCQRLVARTADGPLNHLWYLAYLLLARAFAAWLRGRDRNATVYVTRGFGRKEVLYGVSDIDLVVLISADGAQSEAARGRVSGRYRRLQRWLPSLTDTILDVPQILDTGSPEELGAAPATAFCLRGSASTGGRAVYYGPSSTQDTIGLHERPGLRGPTEGWRRLAGPRKQLPAPRRRDRSQLRLAAWLELQTWWRHLLEACSRPPGPDTAYLCLKIVAEPARIWLALAHDDYPSSRREVLEVARRKLPEEEQALSRALSLQRAMGRNPEAPTTESLRYLVRLSERIACILEDEVLEAGFTPVALDWTPGELQLAPNACSRLGVLDPALSSHALLPLVDWRALARAGVRSGATVHSEPADETLALASLDPTDPGDLARAARAGNQGAYPTLRSGRLLVLASIRWPRTHLRAVHCPLDDPVSFALLAGESLARYPAVLGWSAEDTARRAVAEHGAWLEHPDVASSGGEALGMLVSAARAALFSESTRECAPRLPLTVAATLRSMRTRASSGSTTLDELDAAYASWRTAGTTPASALIRALRNVVLHMEAYADTN
jgi:hypothetical protein